MRFKSKLAPEQVSLLYSLMVPFSRLSSSSSSDRSVLMLDNTHVRFSCKGKSQDTDGVECYGEFKAGGGLFLEHRIESAADNNIILMELDLGQFKVALQSICSSSSPNEQRHSGETGTSSSNSILPLDQRYTILKLAKRNNIPCLCLEACTVGSSSGSSSTAAAIQVHHAIPVRILRATEKQYHLPPRIATPDVQLQMLTSYNNNNNNNNKPLRVVLEKMRSMKTIHSRGQQQTVYVQGNNRTGELTVSLDSDGASIRTYFGKLIPVVQQPQPQPRSNDENNNNNNTTTTSTTTPPVVEECTVKVDAKKMCAALQWQQQTHIASSAMICLSENERLVLHVTLNPAVVGFFTYYVPVHYLPNDPQDE